MGESSITSNLWVIVRDASSQRQGGQLLRNKTLAGHIHILVDASAHLRTHVHMNTHMPAQTHTEEMKSFPMLSLFIETLALTLILNGLILPNK